MERFLRRCMQAFLASSLLLSSVPALAAEPSNAQPDEETAERIYKICQKADGENKERCLQRQLVRWQNSQSVTRGRSAYQTYDRYDWGNNHLRNTTAEKRREEFRKEALKRRTFREDPVNEELNIGNRTYLQDYQAKRLECQLKPKGRSRSQCLEKVAQDMRTASRAAGGPMQYPAK